jgi:hypothetical protein
MPAGAICPARRERTFEGVPFMGEEVDDTTKIAYTQENSISDLNSLPIIKIRSIAPFRKSLSYPPYFQLLTE